MTSARAYQLTPNMTAVDGGTSVYVPHAEDAASSTLEANESCALLAPIPRPFPNCRFARSCQSCLQKTGCMVNSAGRCSESHENDSSKLQPFSIADSWSPSLSSVRPQRWIFPGHSTQYCTETDRICQACLANSAFMQANDSRFCVGDGGCVCIANCIDTTLLPVGKALLICSTRFDAKTLGDTSTSTLNVVTILQILGLVGGALLVATFIMSYRISRARRVHRERELQLERIRQARRSSHRTSRKLRVGQLTLTGWAAHREAVSCSQDVAVPFDIVSCYVAIGDDAPEPANRQILGLLSGVVFLACIQNARNQKRVEAKMGGKQSKLKKEIEVLKAEAAAATAKHSHDVETLCNEKRMLEFKLLTLQEMTAKAQVEADMATQLAVENEEKVKALKWELVRRVSVPASSGTFSSVASTSSSNSSLATNTSGTETSSTPRLAVSWKLKEGVALRRSSTTSVPTAKSKPPREGSETVKRSLGDPVPASKENSVHCVPLAKPQGKTQKPTDTIDQQSSNQEDPVKGDLSKTAIAAPAVASPPAAFDMFAPVKRRSSTKDVLVTTTADAKADAAEPVERLARGDRKLLAKDSDDEREPSSKPDSSSTGSDREADSSRGRGVRTAAKSRDPHQTNKRDDVLALSDDEED